MVGFDQNVIIILTCIVYISPQIDAAINSGNSGGPALKDGSIVGVAFETLNKAENIGYIIPVMFFTVYQIDFLVYCSITYHLFLTFTVLLVLFKLVQEVAPDIILPPRVSLSFHFSKVALHNFTPAEACREKWIYYS